MLRFLGFFAVITINKGCIKENNCHLENNQIIHDIYTAMCQLAMGIHSKNAMLRDFDVVPTP